MGLHPKFTVSMALQTVNFKYRKVWSDMVGRNEPGQSERTKEVLCVCERISSEDTISQNILCFLNTGLLGDSIVLNKSFGIMFCDSR